jgi:hypothetical protein
MDASHADIAAQFHRLSRTQKTYVLARIGHLETVHLREVIAFHPEYQDALHRINNSVHRLSGYTMTVLTTEHDEERDLSFMTMVLLEFEKRHPHSVKEVAAWIADAPNRLQ